MPHSIQQQLYWWLQVSDVQPIDYTTGKYPTISKSWINHWQRIISVYRSREYLTLEEVQQLIEAAQLVGRHLVRDRTLLLLMFRHGLRASEASLLRWDAVMLKSGTIALMRLKDSEGGVHPLQPDECEALQELR